MYAELVLAFAKEEGCTERLKATDQMLWVRKMNNAAQRARELVNAENLPIKITNIQRTPLLC